ncbi:hypothetical protein QFZ34_003362 [Phyllobacterium ifriqiyense]|uniref:Uncharacterized protein n=1 Tax=Phyllobacterium ifriqiyense TaxID=314238 RepID=A0ABU0SBN9_9HYPH|nr:hypothetical protein [Phyllobacterium ifriqiyense]MDQ0998180.1 hypothetical protein [Phyllobacterium ifriqiyense]
MNKRTETLEVLKAELSRLCALADDEGFEMIAYFIETAIRESDEQLSQERRPVVGMELRLASSRSGTVG